MKTWTFNEDQLGAALEEWGQSKRPNGSTAKSVVAVHDFLNSCAAANIRTDEPAVTTTRVSVDTEAAWPFPKGET